MTDDQKRRRLQAAGWIRSSRRDGERWGRPGKTVNGYFYRPLPLAHAYDSLVRLEQSAKTRSR